MILESAPILSPCFNKIISPGTSSLVGISNSMPSLKTIDFNAAISLKDSSAF